MVLSCDDKVHKVCFFLFLLFVYLFFMLYNCGVAASCCNGVLKPLNVAFNSY